MATKGHAAVIIDFNARGFVRQPVGRGQDVTSVYRVSVLEEGGPVRTLSAGNPDPNCLFGPKETRFAFGVHYAPNLVVRAEEIPSLQSALAPKKLGRVGWTGLRGFLGHQLSDVRTEVRVREVTRALGGSEYTHVPDPGSVVDRVDRIGGPTVAERR